MGDFIRGYNKNLERLLDSGVKVALLFGDRDYRVNCEPLSIHQRGENHH